MTASLPIWDRYRITSIYPTRFLKLNYALWDRIHAYMYSDGGIKSRRVCFEVKKVSKLLLTRVFKAITLSMLAKVSLVLLLKAVLL